MTEGLLRGGVCVAVALLVVNWSAHAVGPAEDCARYSSCGECRASSAACGWCSTASSPTPRCVALSAPLEPGASCAPCEERNRSVREVNTCDDSGCLGVSGRTCSGHGTCKCGTCTCEPGYTGRVCQNCPSRWDDCPDRLSRQTVRSACCNFMHCVDWPSKCARCMRNERNATLCDICPRDTLLVDSDPGRRQSAECVFDSVSFSSNLHCSYHVYYWRDEAAALALHARVQLDCGEAANKAIFPPKRTEPPESVPTTPAPTRVPTPATPAVPAMPPVPAVPAASVPPRAPAKTAPEKAAETETTERREGAEKLSSATTAAAFRQAAVMACCLWTVWSMS